MLAYRPEQQITVAKLVAIDPEATLAEKRAAVWRAVRMIWEPENAYDTRAERLRRQRLFKAARLEWSERRRKTAAMLELLAALRDQENAPRGTLLDRVA